MRISDWSSDVCSSDLLMRNRYIAYAIPWIDVIPVDVQERGAHLIVAKTPRIPSESVDPTVKNYHWGDLVRAMFEAEAAGADNAVLLDRDGHVTEEIGRASCRERVCQYV